MSLQALLLRQIDDLQQTATERARARCRLAALFEDSGKYESALDALSPYWERTGLLPRVDDLEPEGRAEVLLRAGVLTSHFGHAKQIVGAHQNAMDLIGRAATTFASLGQSARYAEAQSELGFCYWREGAWEEAKIRYDEALSHLGEDDGDLKALVLIRKAMAEGCATRFVDALAGLAEAEPLVGASASDSLKGRFHMNRAIILKNLITGADRENYVDRAIVENAAAAFHLERAGHTRYLARVENNLGLLLFTAGKFGEAHEHLARAAKLFGRLGDSGSAAHVGETLARVLLAEGKVVEAERAARGAVVVFETGNDYALLAEALATHATTVARLGRFEEARSAFSRAADTAEQRGNNEGAGDALLSMIEELHERLPVSEIKTLYERADALLSKTQQPELQRRLLGAARILISAHLERVAPYASGSFIHGSKVTEDILRRAHDWASASANSRTPILITGETGTGKEVIAGLVHEWSGRTGRFVPVNCAALSESLFEATLFGHVRGAFTDADRDRPGLAREAAGGTLFLDEIGDLSPSNQVKVLRLIDLGEIQPLGAEGVEKVDIHIVAATNRNLSQMVAEGAFRRDLLYRLNGFGVELPPLRKRADDIPPLAEYFLRQASERHRREVHFSKDALARLKELPLPGNARELRSLAERAVLSAEPGETISAEKVDALAVLRSGVVGSNAAWSGFSLKEEVLKFEGNFIRLALSDAQGSVTKAAKFLGMPHQKLAAIIAGRHAELTNARKPVRPRKRSLFKRKKRKSSKS